MTDGDDGSGGDEDAGRDPGEGPDSVVNGEVSDEHGEGDDDLEEDLERVIRDHGLFEWLDLRVERLEPGRAVFEVPFDEKFVNPGSGAVHGGITATLVDTASGFALRSTFEDPYAARLTTTDLNVRYVRPVRGDVRVDATVVRAGGSMGVTECEVTTVHRGEQTVVATGGTSYRLFRDT